MLNVLSVCLLGSDPHGCVRASKSLMQQGFVPAEGFEWQEGKLDAWSHPSQLAAENCILRTPAGFACCVGPLWYRGRFGVAALHLMIDETGELDETELRGNFALLLGKDQRCFLMNDALGFVRIYASADKRFYSTSWLAICAYAGHVELDEQAAVEYVLLGASHSDSTVARGITTLPLAHSIDLTRGRAYSRFLPGDWIGTTVPSSFDEAVDEADALMRTIFREIATAFPARVRTALSGGFDSRLILAGLLVSGVRPELFVYGGKGSGDIAIARSVAASVGLPLDVIDKDKLNRQWRPPDIERLVQNALFFDGLPNDGLHDSGADQQTRLQSMAGGCLTPNGGGGEIFRNFFHLPDRPFHPVDVVRAFYRGFDPRMFRRRHGLATYQDRMVASIESTLGIDRSRTDRRLGRTEVELLYPLFRCHHWMSVNNSVAIRHGYYATPLVDPNTVRLASRLPLAWKNAGKLESRLIASLHRGIADQPSSYGFRFSDGPNRRAYLSEWSNCMRPVFARPVINAARRRLHDIGANAGLTAHGRSLVPGDWRLDAVLELEKLPDNMAFSRALTVEIVWRQLVG
jgi:asparagine synthase (glutamine-hydrolysing)